MQEKENPEPIPTIDSFLSCRLANGQTMLLSLSQYSFFKIFAGYRDLETPRLAMKYVNAV